MKCCSEASSVVQGSKTGGAERLHQLAWLQQQGMGCLGYFPGPPALCAWETATLSAPVLEGMAIWFLPWSRLAVAVQAFPKMSLFSTACQVVVFSRLLDCFGFLKGSGGGGGNFRKNDSEISENKPKRICAGFFSLS